MKELLKREPSGLGKKKIVYTESEIFEMRKAWSEQSDELAKTRRNLESSESQNMRLENTVNSTKKENEKLESAVNSSRRENEKLEGDNSILNLKLDELSAILSSDGDGSEQWLTVSLREDDPNDEVSFLVSSINELGFLQGYLRAVNGVPVVSALSRSEILAALTRAEARAKDDDMERASEKFL